MLRLLTIFLVIHLAISTPVGLPSKLERKQPIWQTSGKFQGDMILSPAQRNGLIDEKYRWKNAELVYEFSSDFTDAEEQFIEESLKDMYKDTCITFRKRTPKDFDYVHILGKDTGCWSYVGRNGGIQLLNLQRSGCIHAGIIAHEFLHALGFYHQQSATERDDYVDILWQNIIPGTEHNFEKLADNVITSFGEKYDYGSIMHYDGYAFSVNGEPTIVAKDPNVELGQIDNLSETDIVKLSKMYGCV